MPISDWPGVVIHGGVGDDYGDYTDYGSPKYGRVARLYLRDLGMTGAVPAVLGRLTTLNGLDLGLNRLTSLPAEIGKLVSLTFLNMYGNQLTSVPPEIGQLTELVSLDFQYNQLTSVPVELKRLTKLKSLGLRGNPLTSAVRKRCGRD